MAEAEHYKFPLEERIFLLTHYKHNVAKGPINSGYLV